MNQKLIFFVVAGLLALGFVGATVYYKSQAPAGAAAEATQRAGAPTKGAEDAKVTIVEFFDPACGTCAQFYPMVAQMVKQYDGKVRVMMRYAPLHAGSDQVVKMLEAAHLQDKFWEAAEVLFRNQNRWVFNHQAQPQRARSLLNSIALDHARLDADMNSPGVTAAIEADVRDLQALGVRATPEFFVNGKPLPSFGWDQLQRLVSKAVEANY